MRPSDFIAHCVSRRRGLVLASRDRIVAVCVTILVTRIRLDSEVLNMFPGDFSRWKG